MCFSKVTPNTCPNRQSSNLQEVRKLTLPFKRKKKKEKKRKKKPPPKLPAPALNPPGTPSPCGFAQPGSGPRGLRGCAAFMWPHSPRAQPSHERTHMSHSPRLLSHSALSECLITVISVRLSFQHILPSLSPEPAQAFVPFQL